MNKSKVKNQRSKAKKAKKINAPKQKTNLLSKLSGANIGLGKKKNNQSLWQKIGSRKDKEAFVENLGLLIESGLDLGLSLDSLRKSARSPYMKNKVEKMTESINVGEPLWKSMGVVELFPEHILAIVRSGEEGGRLPEILKLVTSQLERAREFQTKLRSAMIYPAFVLFIAFVIMVVSFTFTIPNMAKAFEDTSIELPLPTRILVGMGNFTQAYGVIFFPALALLVTALIYYAFINKTTKKYGQAFLLKIPVLRTLIQQIELSRMGYVMGNMLEAGFSVHNSFGWLKQASSFEVYKDAYSKIQEKIGYGNTFEMSFKEIDGLTKLIPDQFQQFIFAAELSGNLPNAFTKLGKSFDSKIDITTKNITVALEPMLLITLGVFVFFVALAIFMPIYNLVGAI